MTMTREEWLNSVANELAETVFKPAGYTVPKNIRYACGFPSKNALSSSRQRIGECWSDKVSGDGYFEIIINPTVGDGLKAADILAHEMAHATVGNEHHHGRPFIKCVRAIGMLGKPTSTNAGPELLIKLQEIIDKVGEYPHAALKASVHRSGKVAPQMIKLLCEACRSEGGRYMLRMGDHSFRNLGAPECPKHKITMVCN